MELKDYLYIVGILVTLLIGILNFRILQSNKKNSMREYIFRQQIEVISKLFIQLNILNSIIDKLCNNDLKKSDIDFIEEIEKVETIVYENEFILTNEILVKLTNVLDEATQFYNSSLSDNRIEINEFYKRYYKRYYKGYDIFLNEARLSFGIEYLTKENQRLHKTTVKINND